MDDHAPPGRPHKFVARQNFSIICEQPCHYRLTFRNYYCVQFIIQSDGQVYVRDGAHSRFSNTKVLEGLSPISGLIPFFRQGTQVDDSIGEQYIRHDEQQESGLNNFLKTHFCISFKSFIMSEKYSTLAPGTNE